MSVFGYWTTYPTSNDNRRLKKIPFDDSIVVILALDIGYVPIYSIDFQIIG